MGSVMERIQLHRRLDAERQHGIGSRRSRLHDEPRGHRHPPIVEAPEDQEYQVDDGGRRGERRDGTKQRSDLARLPRCHRRSHNDYDHRDDCD